MKFNDTKVWNLHKKIALLSKSTISCVKTFKRCFFYFLCCIFLKYEFYNCEAQIIIVPKKLMQNLNPVIWIL